MKKTRTVRTSSFLFFIMIGEILPQIALLLVVLANNNFVNILWYLISIAFCVYSFQFGISRKIISLSSADLLIGILLGLFLLGIEWLLSSHLPGSNVATGPRLKLSLFSICVSGPLWEEFIFRYYLNLKTFKGSFSGMIISSLIFSVIHGYVGLLLLALFFLFGIIFSVVDFYRKNVFVSSIAHIVLNTIILLLNFSG